jgi:hypothetical protein
MTRVEKEKLSELAVAMIETADILHSPAADMLVERLNGSDDRDVLDILIGHLHSIKIYEIYRRFDNEASVRDIENLLRIINYNEK